MNTDTYAIICVRVCVQYSAVRYLLWAGLAQRTEGKPWPPLGNDPSHKSAICCYKNNMTCRVMLCVMSCYIMWCYLSCNHMCYIVLCFVVPYHVIQCCIIFCTAMIWCDCSRCKIQWLDRISYPRSSIVLLKDMRLGAFGTSLSPRTDTVSKECSTCNTAPRIDRNCFKNPLFNVDINGDVCVG